MGLGIRVQGEIEDAACQEYLKQQCQAGVGSLRFCGKLNGEQWQPVAQEIILRLKKASVFYQISKDDAAHSDSGAYRLKNFSAASPGHQARAEDKRRVLQDRS